MSTLQRVVQAGRRVIPRGWTPLLNVAARVNPGLREYKARLAGGDHLYLDLRQSMCLGYFFFGGLPHEAGTETLIRHVIKQDGVFVDIGANIGYYTRLASCLVGPGGRVYAFEPMPAALKLLRMNTADLINVEVFPTAISNEEGETDFYVRAMGDTSSLNASPLSEELRVKVSTLDTVLAEIPRIDFIKIDVEGSELNVLRGAKEIIRLHKPIIYFELLQMYGEVHGFGYNDFEQFFQQFNYSLHWINHAANGPELLSSEISNYVIAIPEFKMYMFR